MKARKMRTGILERLGEVITVSVSRIPVRPGRSREDIQRLRGLQTVNFHLSMPNPPLRDSERRFAPRSSALSVPALRAVVIPLELAAPKISALGVADRRTGQCFNHRVV